MIGRWPRWSNFYLPRESPIWKRFFSAHELRVSDWEDGICHALGFPPTKKCLASENVKRRQMKMMREDTRDVEKAMNQKKKSFYSSLSVFCILVGRNGMDVWGFELWRSLICLYLFRFLVQTWRNYLPGQLRWSFFERPGTRNVGRRLSAAVTLDKLDWQGWIGWGEL